MKSKWLELNDTPFKYRIIDVFNDQFYCEFRGPYTNNLIHVGGIYYLSDIGKVEITKIELSDSEVNLRGSFVSQLI